MTKLKDRYARVPARLWRELDLAGLSLGARGLFLWTWSYFADAMSDGFIPAAAVVQVAGPKYAKELSELLDRGVWERVEGGYLDTWFLRGETNMTRETWEERKAATKKRVDKHRGTRDSAHGNEPVTRYPQTQDAGRRTQDAGARSERGARDPESASPLRETLLEAFAGRWELALPHEGRWPRSASDRCVQLVLEAVCDRASPETDLERGLDAYFAHCAELRIRPEFGFELARDFGRWIAASTLPAGGSSAAERRAKVRRLAEAAEAPASGAGDGAGE